MLGVACEEDDRLRAVLGFDGVEPVRDLVERLVPADAFERALAAFTDAAAGSSRVLRCRRTGGSPRPSRRACHESEALPSSPPRG